MITRKTPDDWRELQVETARVLAECGFETEVEAKFETVRGVVELDVLAIEKNDGRAHTVVCECKHWRDTRIPQTIVHAFRTVVADVGANVGYIVSLDGFQSGAFAAANRSNVKLLTWVEFLREFEVTWFDRYFAREIDARLSPIMTYAEPLLPAWFPKLSDSAKTEYLRLKDEYDLFGMLVQSFGPWARLFGRERPLPALPLLERISPGAHLANVPESILKETAYREFLELCTSHGQAAIEKFRSIRRTVVDEPAPDNSE